MDTRQLGELGERIAEAFLQLKGYRLVERNFRFARRELDLIVAKDECVVAVEVKLRRSGRFGSAIEAVDRRKISRLKIALAGYLQSLPRIRRSRIDLVVIDIKESTKSMHVYHIEGIY